MALPYQSVPTTSVIVPESSNRDVRRFIADLLQHVDADITNDKAWEMARRFTGNGYDALEIEKEGWEKLFGETHGGLIFKRFYSFRIMYVDVSFNISTLSSFTQIYQKDTIWPHL